MNNYIIDTNILLVRNEAYMQLLTVDISEEGIANDSGTLLTILLKDRTTNKNIVWASPSYEGMGKPFCADQPIKKNLIIGPYDSIIQPRVEKNKRNQEIRTRKRGEVFTPPWLVDKQVSIVSDEIGDISFESFIALRWLELACGEGPYIVTRYDSITGDIIPVDKRVGFLDRKLQRIAEQSNTENEFIKWSKIAYESSYGYELQGDSLLLARENLLLSFCEYYDYKFSKSPTMKVIKQIATIISYNIFQMNGLTKQTPYSDDSKGNTQLNLFDDVNNQEKMGDMFTLVKDWKNKVLVSMDSISKGDEMMKFDVVIGNPPYQKDGIARDEPLYHYFIDAAEKIGNVSCLITPARFLFNAGQTPKKWNKTILESSHYSVKKYWGNGSKVFPNNEIKGGVSIIYYDINKNMSPIGVFTVYDQLNYIAIKIKNVMQSGSLSEIISSQGIYRFSKLCIEENPQILKIQGKGTKNKIVSKSLEKLSMLFKETILSELDEYTKILARLSNKRISKYILTRLIELPENHNTYRVLVTEANGNGTLGEILSSPIVIEPYVAFTDTFISIGAFSTKIEAESCLKYIKTKFSRVLLGILKVTQHNSRNTWRYIPIQDFTPNSDIDWSQSIENIDQQLYKKYNLSQDEIDFIESKVRAMD